MDKDKVTPPWTYTLQLPHDPRAPGIARAALRLILAAHGRTELAEPAELLASELLTNAHAHTTGTYALRLAPGILDPHHVRVSVWDTDATMPPPFGPVAGAGDEGGRGLYLVRAYAEACGAYAMPVGGGGKVVWAECGGR
ncbi:ATP-binding protein [Streptomyces xanthii]|uniref:ATP-binding protein n=2 Tax=Streptomyces xanthii TaxID=2768069 RepID=A0A7H1BJ72_9ACTN|nr:ATP-binding protein [Streptomyces xanthii]